MESALLRRAFELRLSPPRRNDFAPCMMFDPQFVSCFAPDLKRSILTHHTSAEDVGRVAAAAGDEKQVLSHLVPAEDAKIQESDWAGGIRRHYAGPIVVGTDLLSVEIN